MKRLLVLLFLLPTLTYAQGAGTPPYRGVNNWNLIFGTDNVFDIGANAAQRPRTGYFGTSVITPALMVSGLTATRVPFAGSGGLIEDDADITFAGNTLSLGELVMTGGTACSDPAIRGSDADSGIHIAATTTNICSNAGVIFQATASGTVLNGTASIGSSTDTQLSRQSANVLRMGASGSARRFLGGGANVASATALPAPVAEVYHVTGTTTITSITATGMGTGVCVTLIFDGVLTFTDGSNLKLAGDFVTTADDTIGLCFDGTNWYETHRSVN